MFKFLKDMFSGDDKSCCGCTSNKRKDLKGAEKEQVTGQSERQIDKTNEQSFPASDPPTNY